MEGSARGRYTNSTVAGGGVEPRSLQVAVLQLDHGHRDGVHQQLVGQFLGGQVTWQGQLDPDCSRYRLELGGAGRVGVAAEGHDDEKGMPGITNAQNIE